MILFSSAKAIVFFSIFLGKKNASWKYMCYCQYHWNVLGWVSASGFVSDCIGGIDAEIERLKLVKEKLEGRSGSNQNSWDKSLTWATYAGKSDQEVLADIDSDGNGLVTKDELKNFLVLMTGTELDDIGNAEIDVLWNQLGLQDTIAIAGQVLIGGICGYHLG